MSPTPDPIWWHSGLLVTPTSQQQLSSRLEGLIQAMPGRYVPYFWGVNRVEYAADDLKRGVLTVRALDAVMRDGFHVAIENDAPVRLPIDLAGAARVLVHLTARRDGPAGARTFVPCARDAADVPVGEDGVEIPFLRTRLDLYTDSMPAPASAANSFPLCEVRGEGPSLELTDFMPPTLLVKQDSLLGRRCAAIPDLLREEARGVGERARLIPLVTALPAFEAFLSARAHPFDLYVELCRLAGAVAVLRNDMTPPQFPPYVHDAARAAFDKVVRFVTGSGDEPPFGTARSYTFERDDIWFRLKADKGWTDAMATGPGRQLVLAMDSEADDAAAQRWGDHCVIGTSGAIKTLLSRRIRGLARQPVTHSAWLPTRHDRRFFRITPDGSAAPGEDLLVLADLPEVRDRPGVDRLAGVRPRALHLFVLEPEREYGDA